MNVDKFIEYLIVTDQIDNNLELNENCPICNNNLVKTYNNIYTFYCPNCDIFFNENKTEQYDNNEL